MAKPDTKAPPPQTSAAVTTTAGHKPHPAAGLWHRVVKVPSANFPLHQLEALTVASDGAVSVEKLTHPDRYDIVLGKAIEAMRGRGG